MLLTHSRTYIVIAMPCGGKNIVSKIMNSIFLALQLIKSSSLGLAKPSSLYVHPLTSSMYFRGMWKKT